MITTSWNPLSNATGIEEVLFSLVLRANEDAQLSELLQVSSRYTAAEAYRDGTIMDFKLSFFASAQEQGKFVLYQNVPNPFTEGTIIGFDLPVAATATITIRDAKGALVQVVKGDYSSGYHTIQLTKQMINSATGIFTYTIEAGDYCATKQMVVVKQKKGSVVIEAHIKCPLLTKSIFIKRRFTNRSCTANGGIQPGCRRFAFVAVALCTIAYLC